MKIVNQSVILLTEQSQIFEQNKIIERAGRVCYKSEDKITDDSYISFIKSIINHGHEAVLEHGVLSVHIVCDRGTSHELVRHRMASYCQESTRYCNYEKEKFGEEITVVLPSQINDKTPCYDTWFSAMKVAESRYFNMLFYNATPELARSVLPNSLKTEVVVTANYREWRHFFKLRTTKFAHPDMRQLATMIYTLFKANVPVVFDDIELEV